MHKLRIPFFTACIMALILTCISVFGDTRESTTEGVLTVSFLDVGQGDATFIESPSGTQVLIDGGKGEAVLGVLAQEMGFFDRTIDMVIATHPDLDHIGGLIAVLDHYDIDTIVMTENKSDTPASRSFLERVQKEGARVMYARKGQVYALGNGEAGTTTLQILFPDYDPTNLESNTSSIVARLAYGESSFMLTGDSPSEIEEYIVATADTELVSDVLKAGHHGSQTSSSEIFLSAVNPIAVVISAGKDNSYGHPHKEVTDRFTAHGITQKNTADEGSIVLVSDGTQIWFK